MQVQIENDRHPTPDELLEYHAGDISPEQRSRIQDHLALCPECVRTVLDLDRFPDIPLPGLDERLSKDEIAAEWQRFQETTGQSRSSGNRRASRQPTILPWALAAALFAVVTGLSIQMAQLQQQIEGFSQPRGGVELVELSPLDGRLERREEETEGVQPSPWADRLVLILDLADIRSFQAYEVEIATESRQVVWRGGGLRRAPEGTFALEVPRQFLPAGVYRLRLLGTSSEGPSPVAEYKLRLAG